MHDYSQEEQILEMILFITEIKRPLQPAISIVYTQTCFNTIKFTGITLICTRADSLIKMNH